MAQKRKNDSGELTARNRKKMKLASARTIDVQPVTTNTHPGDENAAAGSSRLASITDSMNGLPSAIDVEKFAKARVFEINAMQKAIKNASGSATHRAWQVLPRHLRRRAASHDVRRVPLRLREKAQAEMDAPRKKTSGHSKPKLGKERRIGRAETFLKRQRDKTWLETHIWHAKRMKMDNLWGYRLALHPTEKSFRPSHRAATHGAILHDASYYSIIELKAPDQVLKILLELCCDPQGPGPGAKSYSDGSRVLETHIYKPSAYPFDLIAPITVMWRPTCSDTETPNRDEDANPTHDEAKEPSADGKKRKKSKGKGKSPEEVHDPQMDTNTKRPDLDSSRVVWIRSHPAVFEDVFDALHKVASLALDTIRRELKQNTTSLEVEIIDLRGEVNAFEIIGPKSSQVIKGALVLVSDKREEFKKFWPSLANLQTAGSVPRGMVIGCKVQDPRLKFPPSNAKLHSDASDAAALMTVPSPSLAQSEIWETATRDKLKVPRYKKKDLDGRRSKLLIPGTGLQPLRQDDRVPILLIQRSLSDSNGLHGWTLIVPAGWSMAFFSSLIYTGTRTGGLRERHMQFFESGVAHFPQDYPSTRVYATHSAARAAEEKSRWDRKPPAKRPNFETLGTRSPWDPDWEIVLGLNAETQYVTTQREPVSRETDTQLKVEPWLLRGSEVANTLRRAFGMFNPGAGLRSEMDVLRVKRGHEPLSRSIKCEALWKTALAMVRVLMCGRGAPDDLAIIYHMDDGAVRKLATELEKRSSGISDPAPDEESNDVMCLGDCPSADHIVGYITTGHFSFSRGEGFSIGAIPVARLYDLHEQAQRIQTRSTSRSTTSKPLDLFVKVRDRDGHKCRAARVELLDA